MKKFLTIILAGMFLVFPVQAQEFEGDKPKQEPVRFDAIDVYVGSGKLALGAYQFELVAEVGSVTIVGIEGGEHAAYKEPPYYDPEALSKHRVIIAAFNTGKDLPNGRTRVARVHMQVSGDKKPQYVVKLHVAASADGERIPSTATLEKGVRK